MYIPDCTQLCAGTCDHVIFSILTADFHGKINKLKSMRLRLLMYLIWILHLLLQDTGIIQPDLHTFRIVVNCSLVGSQGLPR